jgi:hypothetical protein
MLKSKGELFRQLPVLMCVRRKSSKFSLTRWGVGLCGMNVKMTVWYFPKLWKSFEFPQLIEPAELGVAVTLLVDGLRVWATEAKVQ